MGVYAKRATGVYKRHYAPRSWESITLPSICAEGTPSDTADYAGFKEAQNRCFFGKNGKPMQLPYYIKNTHIYRQPDLRTRLALLEKNRTIYFFRTPSPESIDWHRNPFENTCSLHNKTWCQIPDYLPEQGDPRTMWEPSRAAWAFDIGRARVHGNECESEALFWRWVQSWMEANPPFLGFQWKCGQESAVRLIALLFGFWNVIGKEGNPSNAWETMARLAWVTGYRIDYQIAYAVSQKNNHAISESCGLMLIAYLFPEFKESLNWWKKGRTVLEKELKRQVYSDGTYVQHSMNYHRVMLQGATLALRIGEWAGESFSKDIYEIIGKCTTFLCEMMDPKTGKVPMYGNNDGAWILPINECDFWDFRSTVQVAYYLVTRRLLFEQGPWDEDIYWFFGLEALNSARDTKKVRQSSCFSEGGYYTIRRKSSWGMVRCHTYRDRPGHTDPLHLDLWWDGSNILHDCGTYKYYAPERPEFEQYFDGARSHNVVMIDTTEPSERVSRFQKFPWTKAKCIGHSDDGEVGMFEGMFDGYNRNPWKVRWRRIVLSFGKSVWVIIDDCVGEGKHTVTQYWHCCEGLKKSIRNGNEYVLSKGTSKYTIQLFSWPLPLLSSRMVIGEDADGIVQGYAAPQYGERVPIPVIESIYNGPMPARIITCITNNKKCGVQLSNDIEHPEFKIYSPDCTFDVHIGYPTGEDRSIVSGG